MRQTRGFSLIETTMAALVVGLLLAATLNGVGSLARSRNATNEEAAGLALAQRLLEELLALPYNDPQTGDCVLTPGAGEAGSNRALFDNVGDYGGFSESVPRDKSGGAIAGVPAYGLSVALSYVVPATPAATTGTDQGAVRITITATRGTRTVATLSAVRTRAYDTSVLTPPNTTGTRSTASATDLGSM